MLLSETFVQSMETGEQFGSLEKQHTQ